MAQPTDYVPWSVFEWFVGIQGAVGAAFMGLILRYLKGHLKEDDERFEKMDKKLDMEHMENKEDLQRTRADVLAGQRGLADQFGALRRVLDDILLRRRDHNS